MDVLEMLRARKLKRDRLRALSSAPTASPSPPSSRRAPPSSRGLPAAWRIVRFRVVDEQLVPLMRGLLARVGIDEWNATAQRDGSTWTPAMVGHEAKSIRPNLPRGGWREEDLTAEYVYGHTAAEPEYDEIGTLTVDAEPVGPRLVAVSAAQLAAQVARYQSANEGFEPLAPKAGSIARLATEAAATVTSALKAAWIVVRLLPPDRGAHHVREILHAWRTGGLADVVGALHTLQQEMGARSGGEGFARALAAAEELVRASKTAAPPSAPERSPVVAAAPQRPPTLYDDTYTGQRWIYGLQNRPPSFGGAPAGRIIGADRPHPRFRHGTIAYPFPLKKDQIDAFELEIVPEGPGSRFLVDEDAWESMPDNALEALRAASDAAGVTWAPRLDQYVSSDLYGPARAAMADALQSLPFVEVDVDTGKKIREHAPTAKREPIGQIAARAAEELRRLAGRVAGTSSGVAAALRQAAVNLGMTVGPKGIPYVSDETVPWLRRFAAAGVVAEVERILAPFEVTGDSQGAAFWTLYAAGVKPIQNHTSRSAALAALDAEAKKHPSREAYIRADRTSDGTRHVDRNGWATGALVAQYGFNEQCGRWMVSMTGHG